MTINKLITMLECIVKNGFADGESEIECDHIVCDADYGFRLYDYNILGVKVYNNGDVSIELATKGEPET